MPLSSTLSHDRDDDVHCDDDDDDDDDSEEYDGDYYDDDDGGGGGDGDDGSYIHFGWSCLDMKKKKMMISEKNCN